ncbi:MAG: response regulator [Acidobacteria bacterium]|nr:response regulator [Acidobacteriota bacterium]
MQTDRVSEALKESEDKYRFLTGTMREGVAVHELLYDQSGRAIDYRVLDVNPAYERLLNIPASRAIGAKASELYGTGEPPLLDTYARVVSTGAPAVVETHFDRLRKRFRISAFSSRPPRFTTVFEDTTRQREREAHFWQRQRMEAIGRLAGGVAHDLNNLLTAILGYGELLLDQLDEGDPRREDVDQIRSAGENAAALTRQLLAFGRRQVLNPVVLRLDETVSGMEKMLRRVVGEAVRLRIVADPHQEAVKVDPGQAEQIIMNLAVNARDAMPRGGELVIETRNVTIGPDEPAVAGQMDPGTYGLLRIADSGTGMSPETKAHIFEPFFTTKEQGKGTGLGLSTVYGIVKQSGGYIWVESEPDQGAVFSVYLPATAERPSLRTGPSAPPRAVGGDETILLIEEQPAIMSIATETLQRRGYRVLRSTGGEDALSVANCCKGPIHLAIIDPMMHGPDAAEVIARLQRERPQLRVLYASGYTVQFNPQGVPDPSAPFLQKPFTAAELLGKVRETLNA